MTHEEAIIVADSAHASQRLSNTVAAAREALFNAGGIRLVTIGSGKMMVAVTPDTQSHADAYNALAAISLP